MAGPRHNRHIDTLKTNNLEGMRSVTMRRCARLPSTRLRGNNALPARSSALHACMTSQARRQLGRGSIEAGPCEVPPFCTLHRFAPGPATART